MKTKFLMSLTLLTVCGITFTSLEGCKKDEPTIIPVVQSEDISLTQLKEFLGSLIALKADQISFDSSTSQFSVNGVNQINREDLTKIYKQNNKKK